MGRILLHWFWTYPMAILLVCLESNFWSSSEMVPIWYTVAIYILVVGGLVGFIIEFILNLVKEVRIQRREDNHESNCM